MQDFVSELTTPEKKEGESSSELEEEETGEAGEELTCPVNAHLVANASVDFPEPFDPLPPRPRTQANPQLDRSKVAGERNEPKPARDTRSNVTTEEVVGGGGGKRQRQRQLEE